MIKLPLLGEVGIDISTFYDLYLTNIAFAVAKKPYSFQLTSLMFNDGGADLLGQSQCMTTKKINLSTFFILSKGGEQSNKTKKSLHVA